MANTSLPSPTAKNSAKPSALLQQLQADFPDFTFKSGPKFAFHPPHTIILAENPSETLAKTALLTLHELGHAVSGHQDYQTHVERLKIEREAWDAAKKLFQKYQNQGLIPSDTPWDENFIEEQLDTYRNWLHTKSLCKTCGLTRFQTPDGTYHCPRCDILQ